jgi:hypothetical protein
MLAFMGWNDRWAAVILGVMAGIVTFAWLIAVLAAQANISAGEWLNAMSTFAGVALTIVGTLYLSHHLEERKREKIHENFRGMCAAAASELREKNFTPGYLAIEVGALLEFLEAFDCIIEAQTDGPLAGIMALQNWRTTRKKTLEELNNAVGYVRNRSLSQEAVIELLQENAAQLARALEMIVAAFHSDGAKLAAAMIALRERSDRELAEKRDANGANKGSVP